MNFLNPFGISELFGTRRRKRLERFEKVVEKFADVYMFESDEDESNIYEKVERWAWDVPDDGSWHEDPEWPDVEIKIGLDDRRYDVGVRVGLFRTMTRPVRLSYIGHPDAITVGVVTHGEILLRVQNQTRRILGPTGVFNIERGTRHEITTGLGACFALLYFASTVDHSPV